MILVRRADWGARPPRSVTPLALSAQRGTAVHYTAADADELADHANCPARVRGIQRFHMDSNGWADIAYSYLTCKHGFVFEGRGRGVRTAAQGTDDGNARWHAVCFLGDDTPGRDDVTDQGRRAVRDAVRHCNAWAAVTGVRPHSAFHSTSCPGDQLRAWLAAGLPVQEDDDMLTPAEHDLLERLANGVERLHEDFITLLRGEQHASTQALLAELRKITAAVTGAPTG